MGAKKIPEIEQKKPVFSHLASSNLASSTNLTTLINSKLEKMTDKPLTKNITYKEPEIYDAGGDMSKQWFVFYSFKNPETGKFQRFKIFRDINSHKLKTDRTEAAKAIRQAMSELLAEGFSPFNLFRPELDDFTIFNCIDTFLKSVEGGMRKKSFKKYELTLLIFKKWIGQNGFSGYHIRNIKKEHVFRFLDDFSKERNPSGKTYNFYKNTISRLFSFFLNNYEDVIFRNPVLTIESKPVTIKGNQAYSDELFEEVRAKVLENDPYLWKVCQFVYYAALRNEQELLNLKIGNINLNNMTIVLPGTVTKAKTIQGIPIYPELVPVIESIGIQGLDPDWYVFGRNNKPGPVRVGEDNFARRFRKIKEAIGLGSDYGIYSFKHTRACHMIDDGAELLEIQTLFRHTDLASTMHYLKSLGRISKRKKITSRKI